MIFVNEKAVQLFSCLHCYELTIIIHGFRPEFVFVLLSLNECFKNVTISLNCLPSLDKGHDGRQMTSVISKKKFY